MKHFKKIIGTLTILLGLSMTLVPVTAGAVDVFSACSGNSDSSVCASKGDTVQPIIANVVNTLLFVIGIISVVMIIIGGITYATSAGESAAIKRAKDTILYAIIGLVVAFLAYAIVNWVVFRLT